MEDVRLNRGASSPVVGDDPPIAPPEVDTIAAAGRLGASMVRNVSFSDQITHHAYNPRRPTVAEPLLNVAVQTLALIKQGTLNELPPAQLKQLAKSMSKAFLGLKSIGKMKAVTEPEATPKQLLAIKFRALKNELAQLNEVSHPTKAQKQRIAELKTTIDKLVDDLDRLS